MPLLPGQPGRARCLPHSVPSGWPDWRPMLAADLPEVEAIAAELHPDLPEPGSVFAERLRLFPAGCSMTAGGYAVAHPIRAAAPPALATLLGRLPDGADALHLHDVALRPAARGRGATGALLLRLEAMAKASSLQCLTLVAVHGTGPLWQGHGFTRAPVQPGLGSYGSAAVFMMRAIPARSDGLWG